MSYDDYHVGTNSNYEDLVVGGDEGIEVVAAISQNEYQGDDHWVVRDPTGRFGYLSIAWGSCSGCDAYENADYGTDDRTVAMQELRDELIRNIQWFSSVTELLTWMNERDWAGCSYISNEEIQLLVHLVPK